MSELALLALAVKLPQIHHLHGPTLDYVGLAVAAFASWVGVPGPGEPVLVAAGVLAAKHHLSLGGVVGVAFLAAVIGGVTGWLLGRQAGRKLLTGRGPFRKARRRALEHGDELFDRYPVLAIVLTPAFVAGVHRVHTGTYLLVNVISAVIWAGGIGAAAYYVGPTVLDFVSDIGIVASIVLGVLIVVVVGGAIWRRRHPSAAPG